MAPLPTLLIARTMLQHSTRSIGDNTNEGQSGSVSEEFVLQKLALTFASVSVASSILAFYCFDSAERTRRNQARRSVPPATALTVNGSVTEPRHPLAVYAGRRRKESTSTLYSLANMRNHAHQFMWASVFHSRNRSTSASPPSDISALDTDSYPGASTPQRVSEMTSPALLIPQQVLNPMSPPHFRNSWRESSSRRLSLDSNGSVYTPPVSTDINFVLQQQNEPRESGTLYDMHLINSNGQNLSVSEMIRTREKIGRQLRFLFIYPLVYLGMWIIPFVFHVLQFNDDLAVNPPFALSILSTIFICVQGAVDCWLFSTREKPWRHIPGTDGSFFGSLKFWVVFWGKGKERQGHGPGKTRNEMAREARQAYKRRDEELAQRRVEAQASTGMVRDRGRSDRSWWDVAGMDEMGSVGVVTAMSPVQEEFSIQMDEETGNETQEKSPIDTSAENSEINEKGGSSDV
ncbi:G protein-coupled receptor gpr1 [Ciborinia camelliae]|nr:G protein-coupled receptor gpr1 [Ciborinia camelliae]